MMNYSFYNPNLNNFYKQKNIKIGKMKINGVGILKTEPNIAIINIAIVTENKNLEIAQKENAIKSKNVIDTLYDMNIPKKNISTISYTIEPQYDYIEGKQVFRGYKVTNTLKITVTELNKVGEIIDSAVESGANKVNFIKFTVDDPSTYYNEALQLAIKNSILKAKDIGSTLKVQVSNIPCIIKEKSYLTSPQGTPTLKSAEATTPIIPGEISITAIIKAIFYYKY